MELLKKNTVPIVKTPEIIKKRAEYFLNMLPNDKKEFIEKIIYENYYINYIKDNYIYIFIIIIIIITIYIFSNNIYDYINNIFSANAVQKKKNRNF